MVIFVAQKNPDIICQNELHIFLWDCFPYIWGNSSILLDTLSGKGSNELQLSSSQQTTSLDVQRETWGRCFKPPSEKAMFGISLFCLTYEFTNINILHFSS